MQARHGQLSEEYVGLHKQVMESLVTCMFAYIDWKTKKDTDNRIRITLINI